MRDLTRHRTSLLHERTRTVNRIHKVLEDANIKLSAVASDIMGVSGQAMLRALIAGETDPVRLADLARYRLRRKQAALQQALHGRVRAHHRFLLQTLLEQVGFLDRQVTHVDTRIDEQLRPFAVPLALIRDDPGPETPGG